MIRKDAADNQKFWLYRLTNLINDNRYISQTTEENPKMRWYKHTLDAENGKDMVISQAIKKYGKDNFVWEVIAIGRDKTEEI